MWNFSNELLEPALDPLERARLFAADSVEMAEPVGERGADLDHLLAILAEQAPDLPDVIA
jgi:hypothetical protein